MTDISDKSHDIIGTGRTHRCAWEMVDGLQFGQASPETIPQTFFYLRDEDFWWNDLCLVYISLHAVLNKYLLNEKENK